MAQVVTVGARLGVRTWSGAGRRMTRLKRLAHRAERRSGRAYLDLVADGRIDPLAQPYPTRVRVTGWETS